MTLVVCKVSWSRALDSKERLQCLLIKAAFWVLVGVIGKETDELVGTRATDDEGDGGGEEVFVLGLTLRDSVGPCCC